MFGREELEEVFRSNNLNFTDETKSLIKDLIVNKGLSSLELQNYFMNLEWYMQILNGQNYRIDIYPDNLDSAMSDLFDNSFSAANHIGLREIRQMQVAENEQI